VDLQDVVRLKVQNINKALDTKGVKDYFQKLAGADIISEPIVHWDKAANCNKGFALLDVKTADASKFLAFNNALVKNADGKYAEYRLRIFQVREIIKVVDA
jgi:hypothetical protein